MLKTLFRGSWIGGDDPLRSRLGRLEREVMEVVWRGEDLSVRSVQTQLERPVAYTTVMTTLDRLYKKGFVRRRQAGRAFIYAAAFTRVEMETRVAAGLLNQVLSNGRSSAAPFLSNLVDAIADRDDDLLDELERLVRDRRDRAGRRRR
jgi:predicted transcriptional regulator